MSNTPQLRHGTLATVLAATLLAGCGGGSSTPSDSGGNTTPTPSGGSSCTNLQILDTNGQCVARYSVEPDVASCRPGVLSAAARQNVLTALNTIRALHQLDPVTYDTAGEPAAMSAALLMQANGQLSHTPPSNWNCYSAAGDNGAGSSNLGGGNRSATPEDNLISWLLDTSNLSTTIVGHRRWLLDPFLGKIAYGRSDSSSGALGMWALQVIHADVVTQSSAATFVAYPYQDYPARYHTQGALLSFSVIADPANKNASANVDFSAAQIAVSRRSAGGAVAVTASNISPDNQGFGLANNLQFSIGTISANSIYDVSITNVRVGGVLKNYSYWFRVVS
ncbi:MAG: hypothetical protein RJA44_323 [Pseudomonadota bacterium]